MTHDKFSRYEELLRQRGFRPEQHEETHYLYGRGKEKVRIHHDGMWEYTVGPDKVAGGQLVGMLAAHLPADPINEGFGAIYHHYYQPRLGHVDSAASPSSPDTSNEVHNDLARYDAEHNKNPGHDLETVVGTEMADRLRSIGIHFIKDRRGL